MKLGVEERITLSGILPREGNFLTLKIIRKLREALSFSEQEHRKYDFKTEGTTYINDDGNKVTVPAGTLHWNPKVEQDSEIEIGPQGTKVIVEILQKLDKDGKLSDRHFSLYEKFIGEDLK